MDNNKFENKVSAFLTISFFVVSQVYIATNEKARLFVLGYYESFVLFFIEQSKTDIILTACEIVFIVLLLSKNIGKALSIGIVYMVGIEISKEIYAKLVEAAPIYELTILVMSWFLIGILLSVVGLIITEPHKKNNNDALVGNSETEDKA